MSDIEKKFVIVQDGDSATVGAGTFWSLAGDMQLDRLQEAWEKRSLPSEWLLSTPSDAVALRRAVKSLEGGDLFLETVRSTGEIALVRKSEADGLPAYATLAKWRLNKVMQPEQSFAADDNAAAMHDTVKQRFMYELNNINSNDISMWLRELVESRVRGIVLRESGGFYYVPPTTLPVWQDIKSAVGEASRHTIYNLPMVKSAEAVETILAACMAESEKAIASLTETLEANADGKGPLRERALATQAEKAAAVKEQMASYERFLGVTMPQIADKLETLKAGLFMASAMAAANKV